MRVTRNICDICNTKVGLGHTNLEIFAGEIVLLSPDTNYFLVIQTSKDLCEYCEYLLNYWLKGEPILRQTQAAKRKLWRPRLSNKTLILKMLHKAGDNGMSIGEILSCNPKFKRRTVSPQLSRWAKEGLVVNKNGRHYLADHT